jgi:hypothetical protein
MFKGTINHEILNKKRLRPSHQSKNTTNNLFNREL